MKKLLILFLVGLTIFIAGCVSKTSNQQLQTSEFEVIKTSDNIYFNEENCNSEFLSRTEIVTGQLKSLDCRISIVTEDSFVCVCEFLIE